MSRLSKTNSDGTRSDLLILEKTSLQPNQKLENVHLCKTHLLNTAQTLSFIYSFMLSTKTYSFLQFSTFKWSFHSQSVVVCSVFTRRSYIAFANFDISTHKRYHCLPKFIFLSGWYILVKAEVWIIAGWLYPDWLRRSGSDALSAFAVQKLPVIFALISLTSVFFGNGFS